MQQNEDAIPVEIDFIDPRSMDLDERHAVKMFLGKTFEQAEAMFKENFLFYQEDLSCMRAKAFRFYVLPAIRYLLSDAANGDSDAVSTFCYVLESRLKNDPEAIKPIIPIVIDAINQFLDRFGRYDCSIEIYGDVQGRYGRVLQQLTERAADH